MTVVVRNDVIEAVQVDALAPEVGDREIDLAGMTLMPGMTLGHVHPTLRADGKTPTGRVNSGADRPPGVAMLIAASTCDALLRSGFTGYVGAACPYDVDAQLKMAVEAGILAGPRIRPCSHQINTTGHDNDQAPWWLGIANNGAEEFADGPDELRRLVRSEIRRGAEIIKIFPSGGHGVISHSRRGMAPDEIRAVVEAAHDRNVLVRAHCAWHDLIVECVAAGVDVIDHGDEIDEATLQLMADKGTFWCPSLRFVEAVMDLNTCPSGVDPGEAPKAWANVRRLLPLANALGVRIVPGDDYGIDLLDMPHRAGSYARELELYAETPGIKPLDVLRWATRYGAELLGLAAPAGMIAPGALADLVIVDGDVESDLSFLSHPADSIKAVMLGGSFVVGDAS